MKKSIVLTIVLFMTIVLSAPTIAATIDLQPYTTCGLDKCSISADMSTWLNTAKINALKSADLSKYINKIHGDFTNFSYSWTGSVLTLTANIKPASSNYFTIGYGGDILDPWFNSTYQYCRNISIANNKNNYISYIAVNYSEPMREYLEDVIFVNASCGNDGYRMPFFTRAAYSEANATYDLKLSNTSTISIYYGCDSCGSESNLVNVWGSNLVAYYTFDECAGSLVNDIVNNLDGYWLGGSTWNLTSSKYGCAGQFSGSNWVGVPDNNMLDLTNTWTLEYSGLLSNSNGANGQRGIGKRFGSGTSNYDFGVDSSLRQTVYNGVEDIVSTNNFTAGTMRFAWARRGATSPNLTIGLDSLMFNDTDYVAGAANTLNLSIGSIGYTNQYNWRGVIDEVRIFNTSIDWSTIIATHYAATLPTFTFSAQEQYTTYNTSVRLWLNNVESNLSVSNSTLVNITALLNTTGTVKLIVNGSVYGSGTTSITNLSYFNTTGLYNITGVFDGSGNYNASSKTWFLTSTYTPPAPNVTTINGSIIYDIAALEPNLLFCNNTNLIKVYLEPGINRTITCVYGCDSVLLACNPAPYLTDIINIFLVIFGLAAFLWLMRWLDK